MLTFYEKVRERKTMSKKHEDKLDESIFENQKIIPVQMGKEVKTSFINYAMSVIMSRALPDVRDGFKPVHRRILYAMYEDHLTYDKPVRKSATTVGNVLGRYHPHGDSSVYDAMVRLAQDFSLRYPLIDGQGNFGNLDGDGAAAYRYTEARMSKLADMMMLDIDKNVVDFTPNFDNKLKEPTVLPARFPNLLVNGSMGIAVGMATNIPTHNLGEVIDGTVYLMDNPDCTTKDLMQFIKGPDFPTGAAICGTSGIYSMYETGKGRMRVRSKCEVDEEKRRIIITEIPYQLNKVALVESIVECHKDKKVDGITDVRDESSEDVRIVIEYRRDINGQILLNQLYKYTSLESTFAANMLALVDNVPRILCLKDMLSHYIAHQKEVVTRRLQFELDKAEKEAHIFEGYKIASDNIDEVVEIIKASASVSDAKVNLCERFGLTDPQAQAIVEMTLGRLTGLERQKVEDRLAKLYAIIEDLTDKLSDPAKIAQIIKDDLTEIKNKFNDPRRTEISFDITDIEDEDLIDRHTCVITKTNAGYIKRMSAEAYNAQSRGGKGVKGITTRDEDIVDSVAAVDSHSDLLMFTSFGRVYTKRAFMIPEAGRTSKGTNLVNLLQLQENEKITAMIAVSEYTDDRYLMMVTKHGTVKRTKASEFEYQRKGGKIAISLDDGDELVYVRLTDGSDNVIIATRNGNAVRFDENDARIMGRGARGVRGIRLSDGDYVVGVALVDEECKLLTLTANGFGKRCSFDGFVTRNRGGKGVIVHGISEKTGPLSCIATVHDDDDIVIIADDGVTIRTHVNEISVYSRSASGVIVMRPSEGAQVISLCNVGHADEDYENDENSGGAEVSEAIEQQSDNGEQ